MSSTQTLPVNIFKLGGGQTMLAQDKENFHARCDLASFCQQVDDWPWTLLKITEKIIKRNVFLKKKKKKPRLSTDRCLRTTAPSRTLIAPVKQKVIFLHARRALASVCSNDKHMISRWYDITLITSLPNLFIMIHSLNRGFAARNTFKICNNHSYLSQEPSARSPPLLPVCLTNISNALY